MGRMSVVNDSGDTQEPNGVAHMHNMLPEIDRSDLKKIKSKDLTH
jgi:hypothetical protein